jgi:hypothetical protein
MHAALDGCSAHTQYMVDKLTLLFLSAELEMDDDDEMNLEESVVTAY